MEVNYVSVNCYSLTVVIQNMACPDVWKRGLENGLKVREERQKKKNADNVQANNN